MSGERRDSLAPITRLILEGPLASIILRLAAPNMAAMLVFAGITIYDAYIVGHLGPEALAGVSLVFPLFMLMGTMAHGAFGGAIASRIGRALGARRRTDADALAVHALVLAVGTGCLFAIIVVGSGHGVYATMGATPEVLTGAVSYSNVLFAGAPAIWVSMAAAAILRGSGNMALPSRVFVSTDVLHVLTAPLLTFGIGGFAGFGVAGLAISTVAGSLLRSVVLLGYLASGRGLVRPRLHGLGLHRSRFGELLRIAAPASVHSIVTNVNMILLTSLAAGFGTSTLAGYGIGGRLEYLQIPLAFGLGTALVTVIATNVGAGQEPRAMRAAWIGAGMAGGLCGACGLLGALFRHEWTSLFTDAAEVRAVSELYLLIAGPAYAFLGIGLALYLASQGVGRVSWPVGGAVARLVVAVGGGWVAIRVLDGGVGALFGVIALSLVTFGTFVGLAFTCAVSRRIPSADERRLPADPLSPGATASPRGSPRA